MQDTVIGAPGDAGSGVPTRVRRIVDTHPHVVVALAAATARVAFALVSFAVNHDGLVPDESQYVALASSVAQGRGADTYLGGYGEGLFRTTWVFCAPLTLLMKLFGPTRLVGQLLAATFGVLAAVLSVRLAHEVVSRRLAVLAGLVVALLPSQVLWSSVVLRESMVWSALVGMAVLFALAVRATGNRMAVYLGGITLTLLALGFLRSHATVAAGWALVAAAVLGGGRCRIGRTLAMVVAAVVVPAVVGLGPGGVDLVRDTTTNLDRTRAVLSVDADSGVAAEEAFVDSSGETVPCDVASVDDDVATWTGAPAIAGAEREKRIDSRGRSVIVVCGSDDVLTVVQPGAERTLSYLPTGIATNLLQPYPWSWPSDWLARLAAVENLAWYALYVAAAVGALVHRRHAALLFPFFVTAAILVSSVLTQGNVGTAFRHRGEVLWAVAVVAVAGVGHLVERRLAHEKRS